MKKPAVKKKAFKPVPVATQIARHRKAVVAAKKAAAKPAPPLAAQIASAKKAAATRVRKRAWSPDEDVALCSARAVAESLRIALGVPVSHDDVLALYWLVADDADAGASILDVLSAAGDVFAEPLCYGSPVRMLPDAGTDFGHPLTEQERCPVLVQRQFRAVCDHAHPLILGLDLPDGQSHAVVAHQGAWWSWGEPYRPADFPGAIIDEAWAVTWS